MNKKNYLNIVLNSSFDKFASIFFDLFIGSYILFSGGDIFHVLIFYGVEFGLRGFVHLFAADILRRFEMFYSIAIAYFFLFCFFVIIGLFEVGVLTIIAAAFFHSLGRGIHYPIETFWKSSIVKNSHRGRIYALETIFSNMLVLGGTVLTGYLIEENVVFQLGLSLLSLIISLYFLYQISRVISQADIDFPPKKFYKKSILSAEFRQFALLIFGKNLLILGNIIFIPVLVYLLTDSFAYLGVSFGLATLIEYIYILIAGFLTDKKGKRGIFFINSLIINLLVLIFFFLLFGLLPQAWLILAIIAWKIIAHGLWNLLDVYITERVSLTSNPLEFSMSVEATLCFYEGVTLSVMAFIAYFFSAGVIMSVGLFGVMIASFLIIYSFLISENEFKII